MVIIYELTFMTPQINKYSLAVIVNLVSGPNMIFRAHIITALSNNFWTLHLIFSYVLFNITVPKWNARNYTQI